MVKTGFLPHVLLNDKNMNNTSPLEVDLKK